MDLEARKQKLDSDEARAVRERDRANQAARVMENALFKEAVEAVKDKLWEEFSKSDISDDKARRNARIGLEMLNRILSSLNSHIKTGKLANQELTNIEEERKRLGFWKRLRPVA